MTVGILEDAFIGAKGTIRFTPAPIRSRGI